MRYEETSHRLGKVAVRSFCPNELLALCLNNNNGHRNKRDPLNASGLSKAYSKRKKLRIISIIIAVVKPWREGEINKTVKCYLGPSLVVFVAKKGVRSMKFPEPLQFNQKNVTEQYKMGGICGTKDSFHYHRLHAVQ